MAKAKKVISITLAAIVVILLVIVAGFYFFGEGAIKGAIEKQGSKTLGVGVEVGDLDLKVFKGAVEIDGLVVDNPEGYQLENMLEMKSGKAAVEIGSLTKDTVKIQYLKLDGVHLYVEQKGLSNNLKEVLDSMPKVEEKEEQAAKEGKKKLVIGELELTNISVTAKLLPVAGGDVRLDLAPIRMENLGEDGKMDMAVLTQKILLAIAQGLADKGVGVLPADLVNAIDQGVNEVLGGVGGAIFKQGEGILKEGGSILEEGAGKGGEVIEGVKGLFKKKEE